MPVPHPTDEFDANILPDPELNPLLNPLLAAHMGRWAEVYFTNPPEKRGQAIAELLRELENISPLPPASVQVVHDESREIEIEAAEPPDSSPAAAEPALTCSVCAHQNSAAQRFCGMCGAQLQISPAVHVPQVAEAVPIAGTSWSEPAPSRSFDFGEYAIEPAVNPTAASGSHDALDPTWPLPEKDLPSLGVESEPVPHRYRPYVGIVVAIFLAVLGYLAWRGRETRSSTAPPRSATSSAIPPTRPKPVTSAEQPSTMTAALPEGNPPASPIHGKRQLDANPRKGQGAGARPALPISPVPANSPALATAQTGAEELAMAEKRLNGNPGVTRDSEEAAHWLWKAVGKGNLTAMMTLSDLYLRGEGVPKSCDQARLLLDAAARKGGTAAAERLRNLRAFGCE